jgi:hypothetical protein
LPPGGPAPLVDVPDLLAFAAWLEG